MSDIKDSYGRIARAGAIILVLSLLDKALAVAKEMLIAHRFGVAASLDVFNVAYALPGIVILFFAGAFGSAFVPIYLEWSQRLSPQQANRRALALLYSAVMFFGALALIGYLLSPQLFPLLGYGFDPEQKALGITLERALIFLVFLDGTGIILIGLLHAQKKFFSLYLAPVFINLSIIVLILSGAFPGIRVLVWGFLSGTLVKLLYMLVVVRCSGFRFMARVDFDKDVLRHFLLLALPLLGSELIANSNILIDQVMATQLASGSVSTLRYAFRINDLPVQVVILAVAKAVFPFISEQAICKDHEGLRNTFKHGVVFLGFITFPIICLVALFSRDIVGILLERGAFDAEAARQTAETLLFYNFGLFFYAYAFFNGSFFSALKDTRPLFYLGCLAFVLNVSFNMIFMKFLGIKGIALSTTVTLALVSGIAFFLLKKRLSIEAISDTYGSLLKMLGASVCTFGCGCWLQKYVLPHGLNPFVYLPFAVVLVSLCYLSLLWLFRTRELGTYLNHLAGVFRTS